MMMIPDHHDDGARELEHLLQVGSPGPGGPGPSPDGARLAVTGILSPAPLKSESTGSSCHIRVSGLQEQLVCICNPEVAQVILGNIEINITQYVTEY